MRKLRLNVEDLSVTSFQTGEETESARGTVHANGNIPVPDTQQYTCGQTYCGENTCNCIDFSARTLCGIPFSAYCSAGCGEV